MGLIIFVLGILIFSAYFYPFLGTINLLVFGVMILRNFKLKNFSNVMIGVFFLLPSIFDSLSFLYLILGTILIYGSIRDAITSINSNDKSKDKKEDSCIERIVFDDKIILEIFECSDKRELKYCTFNVIDPTNFDSKNFLNFKSSLEKVLERVNISLKENPNMHFIWN